MADNSPPPPNPRVPINKWRGSRPDPLREPTGSGRGRKLFWATALLLALLGTGLAVILYPAVMPEPTILSIGVREYNSAFYPPNPWAVQDSGLLRSRFVSGSETYREQSYDHFDKILKTLEATKKGPVVVYINALARVSEDQVFVLPGDADPHHSARWVSLKDILKALDKCPVASKLLILDLARPVADVRLGLLNDDISDHVHALLESETLPFFVLCACSRGQRSHIAEELGASIFAHYLEQGLLGRAEGSGSTGNSDQRVFVRELADYVQKRVDRWVWLNRGARQTPHLWGKAKDFALVEATSDEAEKREARTRYPDWLKASWAERDKIHAEGWSSRAPRTFRLLENELLRAEKYWRAGKEESRIKDELGKKVEFYKDLILKSRETKGPRAASLAERSGPKTEEAILEHRQGLKLLLSRAPEPGSKVDDSEKVRLEEYKKIKEEIAGKLKKLPFETGTAVVMAEAARTANLTQGKMLALHELLLDIRQIATSDRHFSETVFLDRVRELEIRVRENEWTWPLAAVHRALQVNRVAEEVLAELSREPELLFPWNLALWQTAEEHRRRGEKALFGGMDFEWRDALEALSQAERHYQKFAARFEFLRQMLRERDRAYLHFSGWAPYLLALGRVSPQLETSWKGGLDATVRLVDLIETHESETLAAEPTSLQQWRSHASAWRRNLESRTKSALRFGEDGKVEDYLELRALLESPRHTASERESLWQSGTKLGLKLHQRVVSLDEDDSRGVTSPPLSLGEDPTAMDEQKRARRRAFVSLDLLRLTPYPTTEALVAQAEKTFASMPFDTKGIRILEKGLSDVWTQLLPKEYRRYVPTDLAKADRLSRIEADLGPEPTSPREAQISFRNPTFAQRHANLESFAILLRERYVQDNQDVERQQSRHASFYLEASSDVRRPQP